jgi:hypothetical protein
MPVEIEWLREGRVMFATYSGQLTSDELLRGINEHAEHALKTPLRVHVIADTRRIISLPNNLLTLHQHNTARLRGVVNGVFVIVSYNRTLITILGVLAKLIPGTEFSFVRTLDEAWCIVNQVLEQEQLGES